MHPLQVEALEKDLIDSSWQLDAMIKEKDSLNEQMLRMKNPSEEALAAVHERALARTLQVSFPPLGARSRARTSPHAHSAGVFSALRHHMAAAWHRLTAPWHPLTALYR